MSTHGPDFSPIRSTFKALAHPYRRSMLEIAAIQPASLMQMCEYLPVKSPTVSYHLNILLESGVLICPMKWGSMQLAYEPSGARFEQLHRYIDSCLMPQWKLEQRGRIVYHFQEGELEACRAALQAIDEKHGCKPPCKRPQNPEGRAHGANILGLMSE